jgi:hypothetical protein
MENGEATQPSDGRKMVVPTIVKKAVRSIVFLAIIFSTSIVIFEIILRVVSYQPNMKMSDYTILFDREVLFRIKPSSAPDINQMGYRDAEFDHKKRRLQRVLFLGDSFVMGSNVPPGQTIAGGLSRALGGGHEVFNMGVLAYGPDQSLLALLEDGLDLIPDMVVLGIFPANDFQDIERNEIFSLGGGGRLIRNPENIVSKNLPKSPTLFLFNRFQYLIQPKIDRNHRILSRKHEYLVRHLIADYYDWELLYDSNADHSKSKIDLMRSILEQFNQILKSKGVDFGVVIIPSYFNIVDLSEFRNIGMDEEYFEEFMEDEKRFFGPEDIVAELCEGLEIPYLNLYPKFLVFDQEERAVLYDGEDWYLSAYGNQLSGDLVASELVEPLLSAPFREINRRPGQRKPQRPWM